MVGLLKGEPGAQSSLAFEEPAANKSEPPRVFPLRLGRMEELLLGPGVGCLEGWPRAVGKRSSIRGG